MFRRHVCLGCLAAALATLARAQAPAEPSRYEFTSLREDVRLLTQRVGELGLTVEQLNRDNAALQAKAGQNFVTLEQLNKAIADLNRSMQAALADNKRETLAQVGTQLEKLARQTQAAIDAVAKNQATRPAVQSNFSDDFPKEGINYTVQAGDTLSVIAHKTNARMQDIINANKISDPTRIRVGQTLFIPQGK
ncbi:MAG TPA: LysM peptidoglycan-binding domain-containing protein [Lacunisphaera sp.]|nr:LysM peptidoglycan-binding domain-containing protein [Lacunisphaera sp.]